MHLPGFALKIGASSIHSTWVFRYIRLKKNMNTCFVAFSKIINFTYFSLINSYDTKNIFNTTQCERVVKDALSAQTSKWIYYHYHWEQQHTDIINLKGYTSSISGVIIMSTTMAVKAQQPAGPRLLRWQRALTPDNRGWGEAFTVESIHIIQTESFVEESRIVCGVRRSTHPLSQVMN